MKDFIKKLFSKEWKFSSFGKIDNTIKNFSITEKSLFYFFVVVLAIIVFIFLAKVSNLFLVEIPVQGGTLNEGVVGSPRFINPILALNDADRDLTSLIYSGLLKATPEGRLVPDLASDYNISDNGLMYTFNIKANAKFHDGADVTADDVVFTIQRLQDATLKSPKRASWDGIIAAKVSDKQVTFTLKQPYSPFLENTTIGILPKHIWKDATSDEFPFSQFNIEPIGSGPYKVAEIKRDGAGLPVSYKLSPFNDYALGAPYIENLTVKFYANGKALLDAYNAGGVDAISAISPQDAIALKNKGVLVERTPLPRIFGVFFNQNEQPLFADKNIRQALNLATDKDAILNKVFNGYGIVIDSPIPEGLNGEKAGYNTFGTTTMAERIAQAKNILWKDGYVPNKDTGILEKIAKSKKVGTPLAFSISTVNTEELKSTAEMLRKMWGDIGAKVEVKIFEAGDLNQNVIRARKYDSLLFGEIIGRDLDLYAFWHSSQRNDPGLNIASYTNSKTDKILEEARTISDFDKRSEKYQAFAAEIKKDAPAVFLYSPDFLYILPPKVKGFEMKYITVPSERFLNINKWFINTEKVWKVFAKDNKLN